MSQFANQKPGSASTCLKITHQTQNTILPEVFFPDSLYKQSSQDHF